MKLRAYLYTFIALFSAASAFIFLNKEKHEEEESFDYAPSEWFFTQRAYPFNTIPYEKYFQAMDRKRMMLEKSSEYSARKWEPAGPYNIGGRITALDVDPDNNNIIYAGAAAGGVFKSTDGGQSWSARTDNFPSLSVGALKIDPQNSSVIYCGTGEANTSGDSYPGFGMLKSTDRGDTWFVSGLENASHIAEIEIHPLKHNTLYVAVSGDLHSKGNNRGIFKSTNGGMSWMRVLFVSDSTSAVDVAVDPSDTNIVYAAMWERMRGPSFRRASGITSAVYRSTDAGSSWQRLAGGLPAPSVRTGRISLAVARSNPDFVYALYKVSSDTFWSDNVFGAFYRSTNKGTTWTKMNDDILPGEFSNFGWYFGCLEVDPADHKKLYLGEIDLLKSTDGGGSWENITNSYSGSFDQQHPDQHALWINPKNPLNLILGNDGGIFKSSSGGKPWTKLYDLPVTQFYASAVDYLHPERIYGGTQDNGTMGTKTGRLADWQEIYGGDGFHTLVDYTNSDIIYAESQWGNMSKSTDGGNSFSYAMNGIDFFDRTNWSTPYIIDIEDHNTLYFGTYRLYRTTDATKTWTSISNDLTRGENGRLGTLTTISCAVLPNGKRAIYTGADDGRVCVTENSGTNWKDISQGLPLRYVTDILADKRSGNVAYVTLSGFNRDQSNSHIFRTTNFGAEWKDISGDLPDVPLNAVIIDYNTDSVLYVGGDAGVYYTTNMGRNWNVLGSGLPNAPVSDLNYHQPSGKLAAATHGRSIYTIDISDIASGVKKDVMNAETFSLGQNYPNPFNPSTKISYYLSGQSHVKLTIYDVKGAVVSVPVDKSEEYGTHEITFNSGKLSSGIYFYRIEVTGIKGSKFSEVKKMVLIR